MTKQNSQVSTSKCIHCGSSRHESEKCPVYLKVKALEEGKPVEFNVMTKEGIHKETFVMDNKLKVFSCPNCGCKNFTMAQRVLTEVDFTQEGAIEGHPFLRRTSTQFDCFLCYDCGEEVPEEQAQEMLKEVM